MRGQEKKISRRRFFGVACATLFCGVALAGIASAQSFDEDAISSSLEDEDMPPSEHEQLARRSNRHEVRDAEPYPEEDEPLPEPEKPQRAGHVIEQLEQVEPDYPIKPVDLRTIKPEFRRKIVEYHGKEWPGTIVVDADNRYLFYILENNLAIRYGVGVGRDGFEWAGEAKIGRKAKWPRWTPPVEMTKRDELAAAWAGGMPGGPNNPLGARALYLYNPATARDLMYRIHGTNQPETIGLAMSSGCVRMLNQDVAELFLRAPVGTRVVVLSSKAPQSFHEESNAQGKGTKER